MGLWLTRKINRGETPLLAAVGCKSIQKIKFLLKKGAHIDAEDQFWGTPSRLSISFKHYEISVFLIENGARVNIENSSGIPSAR
ncbi:MAG: ankyrin repeat domain-containing protein [bacterium]|nr:ankyrin repeat domain-containing protein [bacterium]